MMLLSRFYYVALGIALAALVSVLFVAQNMYNQAQEATAADAIVSNTQVVNWYLAADARNRGTQLVKFALDEAVAKGLAEATNAEGELSDETRKKVRAALREVNKGIEEQYAFDAVFAVDQMGRVVAHLGYEQAGKAEEFELGGYPVVADALHGWIRDDTLVLDRLYRVVARPVETEAGQPPAGAIIGARIIDDRFARELSTRTGAAVSFFIGTDPVATGTPSDFDPNLLSQLRTDLPKVATEDADYAKKGRSAIRKVGPRLMSVQYTRLRGEAYDLEAGFAVARAYRAVGSPVEFFTTATEQEKRGSWLFIALGLGLVAALVGVVLTVLEHTLPISRFAAEARAFGKAERDQLQPSALTGVFRRVAQDLNDGIDHALAKGGGPRRGPADLGKVLGDLPAQPQMSAFSLPSDPVISEPLPSQPGNEDAPPKAPPRPPKPSLPGAPKPPGAPRPPEPAPAAEPMTQAEEWRKVFEDFVALKRSCGEQIEGFTYEKFEQTLKRNEEALVKRHGATRVKFSVYVKDGKAALKASPIKD